MKIVTDYQYLPAGHPASWRAYDEDSYDGATDSRDPVCGYGKTEEEAIDDLKRELADREE